MNTLPESVPFPLAFRAVFAAVVAAGYECLDTDDFDDADPDDIRCELSRAIGEAAGYFTLPSDAETEGELTDIVLAVWEALDQFLIDTTE